MHSNAGVSSYSSPIAPLSAPAMRTVQPSASLMAQQLRPVSATKMARICPALQSKVHI